MENDMAVDDTMAACPQSGSAVAGVKNPVPVRSHMVAAILTTLFCCLIGGIVAIVYAAQVNTKLARGDEAGARAASRVALRWIIANIVFGILYVFFAVFAIFAAVAMPNFISYRKQSQTAACISNMKQIQCACEQCILSGKTPTKENLYGPANYIKTEPVCPLGGTYTFEVKDGEVSVSCPNADEGHVLPSY